MAKQSERHPKLLKALELSEGGCDVETLAERVGVKVVLGLRHQSRTTRIEKGQ
jgi:hypothetical protein